MKKKVIKIIIATILFFTKSDLIRSDNALKKSNMHFFLLYSLHAHTTFLQ